MDLQWQIKIIDELIEENPESTIKDFLEIFYELFVIDNATVQNAIRKEINGQIKKITVKVVGDHLKKHGH